MRHIWLLLGIISTLLGFGTLFYSQEKPTVNLSPVTHGSPARISATPASAITAPSLDKSVETDSSDADSNSINPLQTNVNTGEFANNSANSSASSTRVVPGRRIEVTIEPGRVIRRDLIINRKPLRILNNRDFQTHQVPAISNTEIDHTDRIDH